MNDVQILIEKQKIHELCARYTLTVDGHDIDGWANCFTDEGVFGFGDYGLRGRDKSAAYGRVHQEICSRRLNTSLLLQIDPSGDFAAGQSSVATLFATRRGFKVASLARYDDEFRKVAGRWLISRRWVVADPFPEDPNFDLLNADPDLTPVVQRLLDAYHTLGEPMRTGA